MYIHTHIPIYTYNTYIHTYLYTHAIQYIQNLYTHIHTFHTYNTIQYVHTHTHKHNKQHTGRPHTNIYDVWNINTHISHMHTTFKIGLEPKELHVGMLLIV